MSEETMVMLRWLEAHPLSLMWARAIATDKGAGQLRAWVRQWAPLPAGEGESAYGALLELALERVDYDGLAIALAGQIGR